MKAQVVPDDVPEPARCPSEWTYIAAQGKCLRAVPVKDFWINQRARCRELGGDLVSIHSNESNYATVEFAREAAGVADNVCQAFAIGLFHTRWSGGTMWSDFRWTDGSPFDSYSNLDALYLTYPNGSPTDGVGARMIVCGLDDGYVFDHGAGIAVKNGYWDARDDPDLLAVCQLSA
ncbi:hypothetical protein AAVH_43220 [Aphelenchoides avenae]|nr:hypothetical protein AAVH_43220 [Aphelenchus avenae]